MTTVQKVTLKTVKPTDEDLRRIVASVREMAELGRRLQKCGLNNRAVVTLLHESSGVPKRDIKFVLDHLSTIDSFLVRP